MHSETGSGGRTIATGGTNIIPLNPATRQPSSLPCGGSILPPLSERLKPAGLQAGTAELQACLTLVAPSGMTAEERGQWVQVARQTLSGIPADLLREGCAVARRKCRFPSEIVPAILGAVEDQWQARLRAASMPPREDTAPRLPAPDYIKPEEAKAILAEFGLKRDWSEDPAA